MDTDVLVVGAGPTGLMLANQLVRRGIRTLIIDRHAAPSIETRALGVQARTLEIYSQLGIVDRAQESSSCRTGRSFRPNAVSEYSTRTGISENTSLLTSPSRSSSRNCCVNTFCETRGMLCRRILNRNGFSVPISHQRMTGFQRPPIRTSSSSIGLMLTIRLALIAFLVTRYPFGS